MSVDIPIDQQIEVAGQCSDLIDLLNELCPEASPKFDEAERVIWMKAGKRELINHLIYLRNQSGTDRRRW